MSAVETPRSESRTVMVRIRAALPTLRPSERRIADVLLADPLGAADLSIVDLARRGDTSTTSVVRFYQHIGYRRFRDLRLDLAREAERETVQHADLLTQSGDIDRNDSLADIVAKVASNETLSISDTAAVLDVGALGRAVRLVHKARRVDSFGVGASSFVGLDLHQKLTRIGRTALNWPDAHAAWTSAVTLDRRCVAIGVSHSGATADTVDFLRIAGEAGASTIAITNFGTSPLAGVADVVLTTAARETPFRSGALGSRIAQLMVIDCLFTGVAQASYDDSIAALRRTYTVVHRRHAESP